MTCDTVDKNVYCVTYSEEKCRHWSVVLRVDHCKEFGELLLLGSDIEQPELRRN